MEILAKKLLWGGRIAAICGTAVVAHAETPATTTNAHLAFDFHLPQLQRFYAAPPAASLAAPAAAWLAASPAAAPAQSVELGSRVVIQFADPAQAEGLLAGSSLVKSRVIAGDLFIYQAADALAACREAARLSQLPGIVACYPVMRRTADFNGAYASRPNDTYFYTEWHLEQRDGNGTRMGADLNVRAAWPITRGTGVTIAVADCGVELGHPEFTNRACGAPHFNFDRQTADGSPPGRSSTWAHGTAVAGLAVASFNNQTGMAGVAPEASLASWCIRYTNSLLVSDESLMDAYQYASNVVAVQNHSWGHAGLTQFPLSPLEQFGISNAIAHGRNGRGTIFIRAAGNDRATGGNANDDSYVADPRVVAVAAVTAAGQATYYSEPGACVLVAAHGGDDTTTLFTTDLMGTDGVNGIMYFPPNEHLNDYMYGSLGFKGTSAAAPLVSGIAALMLAANPQLDWCDVPQILALSARHFDAADPDLATNGAGLVVSHNDGCGVPDAAVAVQLAQTWPTGQAHVTVSKAFLCPTPIPDGGLRLAITGDDVPGDLASIACLPGNGPFADQATFALPLVVVSNAWGSITQDLHGKAALFQRMTSGYATALTNIASAGAAFAIMYTTNNANYGPLLKTEAVPIPAVMIPNTPGTSLVERLRLGSTTLAQLQVTSARLALEVTNTLACERVCLRLRTDHTLRGDLHITLTSPCGTRSVLQRLNQDTNAGPVDWTYSSTHHLLESSAGTWVLAITDQVPGATGQVLQATLEIRGRPIKDTDADGLDDDWEILQIGNLASGPSDDLNQDGYNLAREQAMGINPQAAHNAFVMDLSLWNATRARLSWPGRPGLTYQVFSGTNVGPLALTTNLAAGFPETEYFVPLQPGAQFFKVQSAGTGP